MQYKNIPYTPSCQLVLDKFMGVDFRTADTQMNLNRSPFSINMIAGENFYYPKKRNGYKRVSEFSFSGDANGIFCFVKDKVKYLIVHFGTCLYKYNILSSEVNLISNSVFNSKSNGFVLNGVFYFLDSNAYYYFNGEKFDLVSNNAFIPTTTITKSPNGAGVTFEDVNLICSLRKNSFAADGVSTEYYLDAQEIDDTLVKVISNNTELTELTDFTVDRKLGKVIFKKAPVKFSGPDNVVITFSKKIQENYNKINNCTIFGIFGGANDSRVFLSGNINFPNMDFSSGLFDPTYFPDRGYTKIGSDQSPIIGYVKQFNSMLIIKNSFDYDSGIYLRTFELDSNNKALFPLQQGITGVNGICSRSIGILEDVPLFLSDNGIYGVIGSNVYMEKSVENRSAFINSKLLNEKNLSDACCVSFDGKYYLAVNNHCYVADSRQKYFDKSSNNMQYEWYYWENIPAKCFCAFDGYLYFIGNDKIYRFYKNDEDGIYNDDGLAIKAVWRTPLMNLGNNNIKNISKITVVLQPFFKSSCSLYLMSDKKEFTFLDSIYLDILSFDEIDFNRFTFNTLNTPTIWEEKCVVNKINLLCIEISNDNLSEGFGVYAINIDYNLL